MRPRSRHAWPARLAAFVALALLSFASAQSVVMQAAAGDDPAAMWPICAVAAPGKTAPRTGAGDKANGVCSLCAAASATPLVSAAQPAPAPVAVAWRPAPVSHVFGPRGPPRFRPRARAPPSSHHAV